MVLYSPNHLTTLAQEPIERIDKLIRVWTDRFAKLSALPFVKYVFIFENKGEAVGVTLHHPHGQIYAYPFIPPHLERELQQSAAHHVSTGRCLLCDIIAAEQQNRQRIVAANDSFIAYLPFFARWPYELHISPTRHLQALTDLARLEQVRLAEILKQVLVAFDGLYNFSFPYVMVMHQRPSDGGDYPHYHFHLEFYPPLRTRDKLKYLAGSEVGAGVFINDTLPEEKAAELRALVKPVS